MIELLSVVTMIVLLVVIMVYVIVAAQEKMRIALCASNMRQIGLNMAAYARDNRGWYPLWGYPGTGDQVGLGSVGPWTGYDIAGNAYSGTPSGQWGTHLDPVGIMPCLVVSKYTSWGGTYQTNAGYSTGWKIYYCPDLVPSNWFTQTVVKDFWAQPNPPANNTPNIGYHYFNGNSSGWVNLNTTPSNPDYYYTNSYYRGRVVYKPDGTRYNPSSGTASFAAGYIGDPPNWVILADRASYNQSSLSWNTGSANIFNIPSINHDSGMNSLYNDGSVRWASFTTTPYVVPSNWYSLGYGGNPWPNNDIVVAGLIRP